MPPTEKISELFLEIEKLKLSIGRIESHISSESGTLSRETKRLSEEIKQVEISFREIVYHPENGFMVQLDRLIQEREERRKTKQNIIALWIGFGAVAIKAIFDLIIKK